MINIYKFIGKKNKTYELEQKLNANCPESEKSGKGPGSCGGKGSNSDKGSKPKPWDRVPPKGFDITEYTRKPTKKEIQDHISKSPKAKSLSDTVSDDAAEDLGRFGGKPDEDVILDRATEIADEKGLEGEEFKNFVDDYSSEYDKAFKSLETISKKSGKKKK